jgi:hypothetical protein
LVGVRSGELPFGPFGCLPFHFDDELFSVHGDDDVDASSADVRDLDA